MENEAYLQNVIDIGHPWAKSPTTIGSMATMYLSIIFMRDLLPEEDGYQE